MATYDELSKFLDDYDPQQQQLGVGGGAQQLSPYEQMVRERYGTPEQLQQANVQAGGGLLDNGLTRGFAAGVINVPASMASFGAGLIGSDGEIGNYLSQKANEYGGRGREYSLADIKNDPIGYLTDTQNGALYGVGNAFGSSAGFMATAALLAKLGGAALPASVLAGAGKAAQMASKVPGLKYLASDTPVGKLLKANLAGNVLEGFGEGGSEYNQSIRNEDGTINPNADRDEARNKMLKVAALNVPALLLSGGAENALTNAFVKETAGKGLKEALKQGAKAGLINMGQNGLEEGVQTTIGEAVNNKTDYANIVKPWNWSDEAIRDTIEGGLGASGQSVAMGGGSYALNRMFPQQQQAQAGEQPANAEQQQPVQQYVEPKIVHPVTTTQFADAVNVAMNDQSGNLVDRMRHLQGHITYDAKDGTNEENDPDGSVITQPEIKTENTDTEESADEAQEEQTESKLPEQEEPEDKEQEKSHEEDLQISGKTYTDPDGMYTAKSCIKRNSPENTEETIYI